MTHRDYDPLATYDTSGIALPDSVIYNWNVKPMGVEIRQSWLQIIAMLDLIEQYDIEVFIELGLAYGGMGSILVHRTEMVDRFYYFGFDHGDKDLPMNESYLRYVKMHPGGNIFFNDIFEENTVKLIRLLVSLGRTILFCDDGNKKEELKLYAPLCKPGDIIMTHDYTTEVHDEHLEFLVNDPTFTEIPHYRKRYALPAFLKK